jgi:hypothetical protein
MNKSSSDNMTLIGTVDALYYDLQCVGVKVTGISFASSWMTLVRTTQLLSLTQSRSITNR